MKVLLTDTNDTIEMIMDIEDVEELVELMDLYSNNIILKKPWGDDAQRKGIELEVEIYNGYRE